MDSNSVPRPLAIPWGRLTIVALALGAISWPSASIEAQDSGTIAGLVGGYTTTTLLWRPTAETEDAVGILVGAFVEATTPAGWLSFLAEGAYTQRGGDVLSDPQGLPVNGSIRADYLSISVHARAAVSIGRARFHIAVGPTVDQLLRRRMDAVTAPALSRETASVFGVAAGIGAGARVTRGAFAEVEARVFEGLSAAHAGDFLTVRNRSFEVVARVGVPVRR